MSIGWWCIDASNPDDRTAVRAAVLSCCVNRPRVAWPAGHPDRRGSAAWASSSEPEGLSHGLPAIVTLVLQLAQIDGRGGDALMPEERRHRLDRRPCASPQLGRCMSQHVRRDAADPGGLPVAAEVGVEGGVGDREDPIIDG